MYSPIGLVRKDTEKLLNYLCVKVPLSILPAAATSVRTRREDLHVGGGERQQTVNDRLIRLWLDT